jgi:hypothetical protein
MKQSEMVDAYGYAYTLCENKSNLVYLALPIQGSILQHSYYYGCSVWSLTAKLVVELPDGLIRNYFVKVRFTTS